MYRKIAVLAVLLIGLLLAACTTVPQGNAATNAVAGVGGNASTATPATSNGGTTISINAQPTRSDLPAQGIQQGRAQCPNPRSEHVGSGIGVAFKLSQGYWHINQACAGCGEGIEENFLILYQGAPVDVVLPEGSVWWYAFDCFQNDQNGLWERVVRESTDDYWPVTLPSWLSIAGVSQLPPIAGLNTSNAPTPTPQAWVVPQNGQNAPAGPVQGSSDTDPVFSFEPGMVAQGTNKTVEVTGWCTLSWYTNGPEQLTLFLAKDPTTVGPFNGTLSCWPNRPSSGDIGPKPQVKIAAAQSAGVKFDPMPADFVTQ